MNITQSIPFSWALTVIIVLAVLLGTYTVKASQHIYELPSNTASANLSN